MDDPGNTVRDCTTGMLLGDRRKLENTSQPYMGAEKNTSHVDSNPSSGLNQETMEL